MWAEHLRAGSDRNAALPPRRAARSRRFHRVVAMVFTATVAANFVAMAFGPPPPWLTYAPLPPLLVLMVTGLTMLAVSWRRPRSDAAR